MSDQTASDRWSESRARCDAATEAYRMADTYLALCAIPCPPNTAATLKETRVDVLPIIGAATDDLRAALDAIEAVLALHPSDLRTGAGHYCMIPGDDRPRYFCDGVPCPTVRALGVDQ